MAEFTSFINAEAGKPLDLSDVDTPRGESVKAELRRLRAALHEQKVSEALAEKADEQKEQVVDSQSGKKLLACRRTKWPTVPNPP